MKSLKKKLTALSGFFVVSASALADGDWFGTDGVWVNTKTGEARCVQFTLRL